MLYFVLREVWSLTLRGEYRLKVLENRLLGRIFGPKWLEEKEVREKLHDEGFHKLYPSPDIIRMAKLGG
jgi:hypothetical protein